MKPTFQEATEKLKACTTDEEIASALDVSVNTIRRTRADPATRNFRPPPGNWREAIIQLAEERIEALRRLVAALRG